jgi:hypothetical protein
LPNYVFTHAHTIISACEKSCIILLITKSLKPKNEIIINRKHIQLAAAQGTQIEKRTICTKTEGKRREKKKEELFAFYIFMVTVGRIIRAYSTGCRKIFRII